MNELQSFVLSGKPEKDDRMHASEDDDTNENEAEADYSTSAKKQLSEYDAEAETITNSTRHRSRSADWLSFKYCFLRRFVHVYSCSHNSYVKQIILVRTIIYFT